MSTTKADVSMENSDKGAKSNTSDVEPQGSNNIEWTPDNDRHLMMALVFLAVANGQDKANKKVTNPSGKDWEKINLPWQKVADTMATFLGRETVSKDAVNQRYLKHILVDYKNEFPELFEPSPPDSTEAATASTTASAAAPAQKRKRPSNAEKKQKVEKEGPVPKKVKTEAVAQPEKKKQKVEKKGPVAKKMKTGVVAQSDEDDEEMEDQ
ncbi:hypothetical protein F5Y05DRAFT_411520 [Hypoxylon sp. FL0543]|nr:hypothetical protein F5Y05DRAFT_411520 [Hypoxylon sp. FL0543]